MTRKHRLLTLLLALALLLGMTPVPAVAAAPGNTLLAAALTPKEMADYLNELGLFKGTNPNSATPQYDLDKPANRAAAATMLIRLLGKEQEAKAQYDAGALPASPLTDLDWEAATVTWLYANKLANGETTTKFGGTNTVTAQQFATFVLRALGYSDLGDNRDFNYDDALAVAVQKGILTQALSNEYQKKFLRDGIVVMCYNALNLKMNGSSLTLRQKLVNEGVIGQGSIDTPKTLTLTKKYEGGGFISGNGFAQLWYPENETRGNTVCCGDIDGDGKQEVIFGVKTIFCVNPADGTLKWKTDPGAGWYTRDTRAPFQILDWDGDGDMEVFVMTFSDPKANVYIIDGKGNVKTTWTVDNGNSLSQVRAAYPADLDRDGKYELIVGFGVGSTGAQAVYVYNNDGKVRSGWPQPLGYGVYANSITAVDLDNDNQLEIVLTYDDTQIAAFKADGTKVNATAFGSGVTWDKVDFFANYDTVGYNSANLTTSDLRNGIMGTHSGLVAADLGDGQGTKIVGVALINDIKVTSDNMSSSNFENTFSKSAKYFAPFIVNLDRTRYVNKDKGYDWSSIPADTGTILTLGEEVLSNPGTSVSIIDPDCRPVVADLDGDGVKEILYTANDGQVHCFSLDGTEHGAWPFALNGRDTVIPNGIRYASRPAVADVNNDGKLEVIFTTYGPRTPSNERGKLYVLDYTGKVLAEEMLPASYLNTASIDNVFANGSSTTPVVVDAGGKKMIVVMTFSCGLVGYEVN